MDRFLKRPIGLLLLACTTLFFLPLSLRALWDPAEGRLAEIAREMLEMSNWVTPHLQYHPVLKDPPLMTWVTAVALGIGGTGAWVARLSSAVFGLLTVWTTYRLGTNWRGERTGLLAAVILATGLGFFAYTQFLTPHMAFTFWMTLGLLAGSGLIVERSSQRARRLTLLLALGVAGGLMTRGLSGIVLPLLVLGTVYASQGRRSLLSKIHWNTALIVCAVLVLPWYILVTLKNPSFPYQFLSSNFATAGSTRPVYYFVPILALGFLPWSVFLPKALGTWFTHRHAMLQRDPEASVLSIWCFVVFVFYSVIPVKEPGFILPMFPALALLLGGEFDEALGDPEQLSPMPGWVAAGLAVLMAIFFLGLVFLKVQPAVLSVGSPMWKVIFEQGNTLALVLATAIFVIVGVWGMRQTLVCLAGVMLIQVLLLTSLASLAPELDVYRSAYPVAQVLKARAAQGDLLWVHGLEDRAPGLDYYLRRYFLFQTGDGSQDMAVMTPGTWGVTDFPHWQSLRQGAPAGTFQLAYQAGPLIVFRKEK